MIKTVDEMIGMKLITPQTSDNGKIVRRVYLEKGYEIAKEFYLCITVDRRLVETPLFPQGKVESILKK